MNNMNFFTILLCIFLISFKTVSGQTSELLWINEEGSAQKDEGINIAVDSLGNSWVVGRGSIEIKDTTLSNTSFLVKCDSQGKYLWVREIGAKPVDLDVDIQGNCYVCGNFATEANFGDTILVSDAFDNIFIAKYNNQGSLCWAHHAGGTGWTYPHGIAVQSDGKFGITGYFGDSLFAGDVTLISSGQEDIFVVNYDNQGNVSWAESAGGPSWDAGRSITVDHMGNYLITGYFSFSANFADTTIFGLNAADVFTAKYNALGNPIWVRSAQGPYEDWPWGISTDYEGNCFITGSFEDSLVVADTVLREPAPSGDIFIIKYTTGGKLDWAVRAGGPHWDEGLGISTDNLGNCTATGLFSGPASFGDTTITDSNRGWDIFIAQYNSAGKLNWVHHAGGTASDWGTSIASDANGNNYITGYFVGPANFATEILDGFGKEDLFIAKYGLPVIDHIIGKYPFKKNYHLNQNYPNPFNPSTRISFMLPQREQIRLDIYNALGQKVETLINAKMPAGWHEIEFHGENLPSGIYYYRLQAGSYNSVNKMILLR